MTKSELINLRVGTEAKARIAEAAAKKGVSMTTFVIEAAEREAGRVERRPKPKGQHTGVPTFFRALCFEATRGGTSTYRSVAYELCRHIGGSEMPYDVEPEEWQVEMEKLHDVACPCAAGWEDRKATGGMWRVDEPDVEGVWQWFCDHFPKCMKLVPPRRKQVFAEGVRAAFDDEIVEI